MCGDKGLVRDYVLAVHMGTYVRGDEPGTYKPALGLGDCSYVPTGPPRTEAVAKACGRVGCYTDDSNCALALASHLVESKQLSAQGVARKYTDFFFTGRPRGYPDTAKKTLYLIRDGAAASSTGLPPHFPFPGGSFANGGAMRISPLGIAFRNAPRDVLRAAVKAAILSSHRHPEAVDGAVAQAEAVRWLLAQKGNNDAEMGARAAAQPELQALLRSKVEEFLGILVSACESAGMRDVMRALSARLLLLSSGADDHGKKASGRHQDASFDYGGPMNTATDVAELRQLLSSVRRPGSGFDFQIATVHMMPCVFWVFIRYALVQRKPFEAVQRAIALGGDTDTTATMVGALCGALYGFDSSSWLPQRLVQGLENDERGRDYALEVATKLAGLDLRSRDDIVP